MPDNEKARAAWQAGSVVPFLILIFLLIVIADEPIKITKKIKKGR